jgi:predicted  nucleic acid-binding Zn-ribbon protein
MLKSKREAKLDMAAAEAKPVTSEQSSVELTAVMSQLQAKRNAAEDRMAAIGEQRHRMLVDGSPDEAINQLREEHRNLETEVDDIAAAIRMAEARREAALVRERSAAFERRGERLRSEALPGLEGDYRRFLDLGGELASLAEKIAAAESEIRGFNTDAVERKRHDLRIANHARARAGGADVDAPVEQPPRMSGESVDGHRLRVASLQMRRGDKARRGEAFRVLAGRLIEAVGRVGFATSSPRPLRLVETFRHVRGDQFVETIRNAENGSIIVEKPVVVGPVSGAA